MLGFIPSIGPWELGLVLIIVLLIFGPGKLPELGRFLGKSIRDFRKTVSEVEDTIKLEDKSEKKESV